MIEYIKKETKKTTTMLETGYTNGSNTIIAVCTEGVYFLQGTEQGYKWFSAKTGSGYNPCQPQHKGIKEACEWAIDNELRIFLFESKSMNDCKALRDLIVNAFNTQ